jgi:light-regulated signal transduction histidine kinase (bacteriophytochrome)
LSSSLNHLNQVLTINSEKNFTKILRIEREVKKALWKYQQEIERAENIVKTDFICLEFIEYVPFFLENILETLKANAIQYRDLSRPSVIQIRTKVKNQTRLLIVRDNGRVTGLKSQELGIFNSMDAHSENSKTSKNMGLFLVKNQIEALAGDLVEKTCKV